MKNNLPYFTHDNDAHTHPKFRALRARYGWEGYGRFWALNEMIAQADDCRLDLSRPLYLGDCASELGLSDSDFRDFLAFLADPECCGLIRYEDGIVTTERTQEDYSRVEKKRKKDRSRFGGEKRQSASEKPNSTDEKDTEQSRADKSREDKSSSNAAAADSDLTPEHIQEHLASCRSWPMKFDIYTCSRIEAEMRSRDVEDLHFLDFVANRMRAKSRETRIANPTGLFLHLVTQADDAYQAWHARGSPPRADPYDALAWTCTCGYVNRHTGGECLQCHTERGRTS